VAGFVAALGIVVAMAAVAARDVSLRDVRWWLLVPGAAAALAWWVLLARGWALLLRGHVTRHDLGGWTRTQALRYLPGGIWAPASRFVTIRGPAVDRLATVGAENVLALCAALAIGGVALAVAGHPVWLLAVLAAAVPALAARRLARVSRLDRERSRRAAVTYVIALHRLRAVRRARPARGVGMGLAAHGGRQRRHRVGRRARRDHHAGRRRNARAGLRRAAFGRARAGRRGRRSGPMRLVTIVAELAVLVALGRPRAEPEAAPDGGSVPT
jgi:hypothetical protein